MTALWTQPCAGYGSGLEEEEHQGADGDAIHRERGQACDRDYDLHLFGDGRGDDRTPWDIHADGNGFGDGEVAHGFGCGDTSLPATYNIMGRHYTFAGTSLATSFIHQGYPEQYVDSSRVALCRVAALEFIAPSTSDVLALATRSEASP